MTTTEHKSTNEHDAHTLRREMINRGAHVSLIAYDPARSLYVFDELA